MPKKPETGALHGVYCTIYSGLGPELHGVHAFIGVDCLRFQSLSYTIYGGRRGGWKAKGKEIVNKVIMGLMTSTMITSSWSI